MIKDSGERVSFETGAVRDIQDDKGRCDLMPLNIVSLIVVSKFGSSRGNVTILDMLQRFQVESDGYEKFELLQEALDQFIFTYYGGDVVEAMLELSIHFRDGAEKYGIDNWKKGIPEWSYFSSAIRHLLKCIRGDGDENHKRAFMWNIVCLMWTMNENTKQ